MNQIVLNLVASIVAFCVAIFMAFLITKTKLLRKSLIFILSGFVIAVLIHSLTELLEVTSILDAEILIIIMPIFVSVGAILIFTGCYYLLKIVLPIIKLTEVVRDISTGKLDTQMQELDRKDELGELARAFNRTVISLKLAMREQATTAQQPTEKPTDIKE